MKKKIVDIEDIENTDDLTDSSEEVIQVEKVKKPRSEAQKKATLIALAARKEQIKERKLEKEQIDKDLNDELELYKAKIIEKKKKHLEKKAKIELEKQYRQELQLKEDLRNNGVDSDLDDSDSDDEIIEAKPIKTKAKSKAKKAPVIINNFVTTEKTVSQPVKKKIDTPTFLFV
jgi:hypothetical protein